MNQQAKRQPTAAPSVVPWTELRSLTRPQSVFGPYLQKPGITLLFGDPGSGKSFLCAAWAGHAATGTPWAGSEVQPTNVLLWPAEGLWTVHERIEAWQEEHGLKIPPNRLQVVRESGPLDEPDAAHRLGTAIERTNAGLVLIDTLSKTKGSLVENSNDDMTAYLTHVERAASVTGAGAGIVHHKGWSESTHERGASALRGNVDQALEMKRGADSLHHLTMRKNRGGPDDHSQTLEMVTSGNSLVLIPTDRVPLTPQQKQIYKAICGLTKDGNWAQTKEIANTASVDSKRIPEAAKALRAADLIEVQPPHKNGGPARYRAV